MSQPDRDDWPERRLFDLSWQRITAGTSQARQDILAERAPCLPEESRRASR